MIAQLDKEYINARPSKLWDRLISYALFEGRPLTTSGRWLNPIVFSLFRLQKKLPLVKKVDRPIFILGTGRSGTTLLGMLLSLHKQVGYLNEPKAIWHSVYPNEDLIGSYTDKEALYRLNSSMVNVSHILHAHKIYGFYLKVLGKQRVVDKYPEMVFRFDFVKKIFPDARFVFIVRNGFDTSVSIDDWSKKNGKSTQDSVEDWWGKDQRKWNLLLDQILKHDSELGKYYEEFREIKDHKNKAAVEWYLSMKEGLNLCAKHPKDILMIRFEDLTCATETSLNDILCFLGLSHDDKVIQYAKKVVRPVKCKDRFALHYRLSPHFHEVMRALNYSV